MAAASKTGETMESTDQLPPHSIEAEYALLTSMMLCSPGELYGLRAGLNRDMFFSPDAQVVFDSIAGLAGEGKDLDVLVIREDLKRRKMLEEIGGDAHLVKILNSCPSHSHGHHYAGIVQDRALRRRMIEYASRLMQVASGPAKADNAADIGQRALKNLADIVSSGSAAQYQRIGDIAAEVYDSFTASETTLVPLRIPAIDREIGGIGLGETCILAARPSMGKSTLSRWIAWNVAKAGTPVAYISLEESQAKVARNLFSATCDVDNHRLRKGHLEPEHWTRLADGLAKMAGVPLFVCDNARRMSEIKSAVAVLTQREGCKLVVIDYLQRIRGAEGVNTYEKVSNISLDISDMGKEFGVAQLVLAQLNRGVNSRENKRPTMADIRDSGQIEQDADGILFLHREDYYRANGEAQGEPDRIAEVIIAKWRDSERGEVVKLKSNLAFQRFDEPDMAREAEQYGL